MSSFAYGWPDSAFGDGPRTAFFPKLVLELRRDSETVAIRYYVNTSDRFGPKSNLALYIEPWHLPSPRPESVAVMIYVGAPPLKSSDWSEVYHLWFVSERSTTYRYDEKVAYNERQRIGTVYIPKNVFDCNNPDYCYLMIEFPDEGTPPFGSPRARKQWDALN